MTITPDPGWLIEAAATVTDEHEDLVITGLREQRHPRNPGVLGRVGQRLLGGADDRFAPAVQRTGPGRDQLDLHGDAVLDVLDRRDQSADEIVPAASRPAQPGAQATLGMAGQTSHLIRVLCPPLDQRQLLEHDIVHMGGEFGALLRTRPDRALTGESANRRGDNASEGDDCRGGDGGDGDSFHKPAF